MEKPHKIIVPRLMPAIDKDIPALVCLEQICFQNDTLIYKDFEKLLVKKNIEVYCVTGEGILIGSIILSLKKKKNWVRIYNFCVHPVVRGQGVGTAMLMAIEKYAQFKKFDYTYLEVAASNYNARTFYESRGYIRFGMYPNYYETGDSAVRMKKQLSPSKIIVN